MTREEKEIRVAKADGKIFNVSEVTIEITHCDEHYRCNPSSAEITPTGHLKFFDLEPTDKDMPRFQGRWDEYQQALDIDIFNVSESEKKSFIRGTNGYFGHWSRKEPNCATIYTYNVLIGIPEGGKVFEAEVRFTATRKHSVTGVANIIPAKS